MDEKCRENTKEAVQKKLHSKAASQSQQPWDGLMSLLQCMLRSASKQHEMREHSSETSEVIATIQEKSQDKEADRKHCKAYNKVEDDGEEMKRRMEGENEENIIKWFREEAEKKRGERRKRLETRGKAMRHLDSPAIDKKDKKGMEEEHSKEEHHGSNHSIPRECNLPQGKACNDISRRLPTLHRVWERRRDHHPCPLKVRKEEENVH